METSKSAFSFWREVIASPIVCERNFLLGAPEPYPGFQLPQKSASVAARKSPSGICERLSPTALTTEKTLVNPAAEALSRFAEMSKRLLEEPTLLRLLEKGPLEKTESDEPAIYSSEFLRGAMEMYRLGEKALATQMKSRVERIKEGRKGRVKAKKSALKLAALLKC